MKGRQFAIALASLLVAGGCGDDDATGPNNATRQASARALWQATHPTRYSFIASRVCECLPDAAGPVRIEVNGSSIVSVTHTITDNAINAALWFDIDDLFDLIDTELAQRPSRLETEYNAQNGHPTYVAYGEREVDGGAVIEVSAFTAIIGGTSGYLRR